MTALQLHSTEVINAGPTELDYAAIKEHGLRTFLTEEDRLPLRILFPRSLALITLSEQAEPNAPLYDIAIEAPDAKSRIVEKLGGGRGSSANGVGIFADMAMASAMGRGDYKKVSASARMNLLKASKKGLSIEDLEKALDGLSKLHVNRIAFEEAKQGRTAT